MYNIPLSGKPFLNENKAYIVNTVTWYAISSWLDWLKENDVYDNTRIIFVSDHGNGNNSLSKEMFKTEKIDGYAKCHLNPILVVKDFNERGTLKIDNTFMSNADVPTLALKGIVEEPKNPFTGNKIPYLDKNDGLEVTIDDLFMPYYSKSDKIFTVKDDSWWKVKENIFEDSSWEKVTE